MDIDRLLRPLNHVLTFVPPKAVFTSKCWYGVVPFVHPKATGILKVMFKVVFKVMDCFHRHLAPLRLAR